MRNRNSKLRLDFRGRAVEFDVPVVMGILNITPDSFSDGGRFFGPEQSLVQAGNMVADGAHIIDIGGESTRPGAGDVSVQEELDRIIPVIERVKREFEIPVSVDTRKAEVARAAVEEAGADLVNDISGLQYSEKMGAEVARLKIPVIIMHIKGTPKDMQINPGYGDVVAEIKDFLRERIGFARSCGIPGSQIIVDPGIGFGKRFQDNLDIIRRLNEFQDLNCPILIGLSRKSFLGEITGEENPRNREAETLAANLVSVLKGAAIIRVHRVGDTVKALKVLRRFRDIF